MGELDQKLSAAIKSGSYDDLKALEEPFARQIGQDPAAMEARRQETKAKYGRTVKAPGDLRKAHKSDQEPMVDEKDALRCIQAIEDLAKIRREARTIRKTRTQPKP